jgi:multiple sugar transport system permease protein
VATHVVLILASFLMVLPFVWEVLTSVKTLGESLQVPPQLLPAEPQWSNIHAVFDAVPFAAQFGNTVVMTVLRTLGQVFFSAAAGFAFARLEFPFKRVIFAVFLSMLMIPSQLFILSQYQVIQSLGLLDTVAALALPGLFGAFGVFLMRQYFLQLPHELMDAARIDGANALQIFFRVMLPLARNGLIALGILAAIWAWNDLLWPLVVNSTPDKVTLSAGLASLQGQFTTNFPVLMAGATLASLPMIVLFIVFQKRMIEGIAASAVKG